MKSINVFVSIVLLFWEIFCYSQVKDASLVVSSDGASQTEAINNTLRNALEQVYGAFISSDTQIIDDVLVKDDITSVTRGSIKKYSIVSQSVLPNGRYLVSLDVTVSPSSFVSYINENTSNEVQFDAASWKAQRDLERLNEKAEEALVLSYMKQLANMDLWERVIIIGEQHDGRRKGISGNIKIKLSNAAKEFFKSMAQAFKKISVKNGQRVIIDGAFMGSLFLDQKATLRNAPSPFFTKVRDPGHDEIHLGMPYLINQLATVIEDDLGNQVFSTTKDHSYYCVKDLDKGVVCYNLANIYGVLYPFYYRGGEGYFHFWIPEERIDPRAHSLIARAEKQ